MSKAVPLVIILIVVGGIVTWGAMTDWTFSGLLPREGAKCTPEKGTKDANSKEYVYDADEECVIVNKCKTGWEPNTGNTACIYSSDGTECTPTGTKITNGKYTFDNAGACKLTSCLNNFEINAAKTNCSNCKDGYKKDGTACKACKDTDVPTLISSTAFKDLPGLTYKTENSNCIPNRMIFGGNDGTSNCHTYCAGTNGAPWNTVTPPEWKGAKCVGVTNENDHKKFSKTVKCETKRMGTDNKLTHKNENKCVCERNDATPWVNKGWSVEGGERLFGKDNITKSWLEGVDVTDGVTNGINYIKTSDGKWPKDVNECLSIAKTKGYKAVGVRADEGNCWGLTSAGLAAGTGMNATSTGNYYMVCVDDKTKKVDPGRCA